MRQIEVSTDVFAEIWRRRVDGEDSEDAILRRILSGTTNLATGDNIVHQSATIEPAPARKPQGVVDRRFNVQFPEGFTVFRRYKGSHFQAKANAGCWNLDGSEDRYSSLNELSKAIGAGTENAWVNWYYHSEHGAVKRVSELRSRESIGSRSQKIVADTADERSQSLRQSYSLSSKANGDSEETSMTWRECVRIVLRSLGGKSNLARIYEEVERFRRMRGLSIPNSLDAIVRRTLEENSSDSEVYKGEHDLFKMQEGRGAGIWALR